MSVSCLLADWCVLLWLWCVQVEPARKVQELAARAHDCINTLTEHMLLLDAAAAQQQQQAQQVFAQLACQMQELWATVQQPSQQQQQQGAAAGGGGGALSVADTVQQLQQLCNVLHQLQHIAHHQQQQQLDSMQPHLQQVQQLVLQLQQLSQRSNLLLQDLQSPSGHTTAGRFEWVDGSLTKAIQSGTWVLLDNANLVNPTVLDRLNGLLEPGGVLQLDEAGGSGGSGGRVVVPHPGFRLLLAYDPKHGEVSRAMRNRGVELFLLPPTATPPAAAAAAAAAAEGASECVRGSGGDADGAHQVRVVKLCCMIGQVVCGMRLSSRCIAVAAVVCGVMCVVEVCGLGCAAKDELLSLPDPP
jgi:midasin